MARRTNLGLLLVLVMAFASGTVGLALGTSVSRLALIVHGVAAFCLLALVRHKVAVVRVGWRLHPSGRWLSLWLAVVVVATTVLGILHTTGVQRQLAGYTTLAWHIGLALVFVPLLAWHVLARRVRPRRTDLSRRSLLRAGLVVGTGTVTYVAVETAIRTASLPGASRRFTGSYLVGASPPETMPVTQWLSDSVPTIDADRYRLVVQTPAGVREWTYAELAGFTDTIRCVIDCTGGWYAEQEWEGAWLHRVLPDPGDARSLEVRSTTGYSRRFSVDDRARLLVAVRAGGRPLDPGHGFPVRLVAPDRRGFWWVKWLTAVTADGTPWWWQPPFPLQ
jgi:DMSO/TMAO reductase YedYZ molybdopterin-dependent catalytic subunit